MALFVNYKNLNYVCTTHCNKYIYYKLYQNVYFQLCKFRAMIEIKINIKKCKLYQKCRYEKYV